MSTPKILALDIETGPLEVYCWDLYDQNIGLNQIKQDWTVISWAAKWLGEPANKIMYMDQSHARNIRDDRKLLKGIWRLLDQADIVLTQNGKAFDIKKLNARFILNGMKPPSSFRQIDTKIIAKKNFAFTSNKLEYMSDKLCEKYKKLKHPEFSGFELWRECLNRNPRAWKEMEKYNKHDVLALEEAYGKFQPWDASIDFNLYSDDHELKCNCGSQRMQKKGFAYTAVGKYQRYICRDCGAQFKSRVNLLSEAKKQTIKREV